MSSCRKIGKPKHCKSAGHYEIEYLEKPVLGSAGQCVFGIKVRNYSDKTYSSIMRIVEIPEGWRVLPDNIPLTVEPGKEQEVEFKAMLPS